MSTIFLLLFSVSYVTSVSINDNLQFLMFENFDLNQENFMDELKIVDILRKYKQDLSDWYDYHKNNVNGLKARKLGCEIIYSLIIH